MNEDNPEPAFEIQSGIPMPRQDGGRTVIDDSELIARAREGRRSNIFRSRNHAAVELAKQVTNHSLEAAIRRLNRKFRDAGIP